MLWKNARDTSVKTAKPKERAAWGQGSPPPAAETADWGYPTLLAEHPLARARSGKPRPRGSFPGTPRGPFNEVRHLKSLAAIANITVQRIRNNTTPLPGQAGAVWGAIEACIANDRRASNGSPVFPASRWSASIICYAAINKIPSCLVREHNFHTRYRRRFPLPVGTRGRKLVPGALQTLAAR